MKCRDAVLVQLYKLWSEETYAAGFIGSEKVFVKAFREWLRKILSENSVTDYEQEMLQEYHRQEQPSNQI